MVECFSSALVSQTENGVQYSAKECRRRAENTGIFRCDVLSYQGPAHGIPGIQGMICNLQLAAWDCLLAHLDAK